MKLYEQVADSIKKRIHQGFFEAGQKLPSIRSMSQSCKVSISTVQEAYRLLEDQKIAFAKPKSGYYVAAKRKISLARPNISRPEQKPLEVSRWEQVFHLVNSNFDTALVQLGRGSPDIHAKTLKPLVNIQQMLLKQQQVSLLSYGELQGNDKLRKQIARLSIDGNAHLHPDDIIVTTGCQEALSASLRVVTKPGDIVVTDSPSFYGSMQAFTVRGLKALEIPTDPETGISIEALELALEQWPVKAIQLTPTCNNPLGYSMPFEHKKRLIELAVQYDIAIIEDDIYGDLAYKAPRPCTIKSMDTDGRVLLCSSFSKTLGPGLRVGWVAPGRYFKQILLEKYVVTAATSNLPQQAIAEFIVTGAYERHIRNMRQQYVTNREQLRVWIEQYFPVGTLVSKPSGGFILWVELDKRVDTLVLYHHCLELGINIAPGILFSASGKYNHCIRLNYTNVNEQGYQEALKTIGDVVRDMITEHEQQPE